MRLANLVDQLADLGRAGEAAQQLPVGERVLVDQLEEALQPRHQLLPRRHRGVRRGAGAQLLGRLLEGGAEVALLAGEVAVQERVGDARCLRDLAHRQLVVGVLREQLDAEAEQLAPPLVDLQAPSAWPSVHASTISLLTSGY